MAGTSPTATRNAACNAVADLVDRGTGPGYADFKEAGGTVAAHLHFNITAAFGDAATGVATMVTDPAVTNGATAVGGTVATMSVYSSGGTSVFDDLAAAAALATGVQVVMSTLAVGAGDTLTLNSMTITMPATTTA